MELEDHHSSPEGKRHLPAVDLVDALILVGLGLLAAGVTVIFGFAWAAVVTGCILLALGLVGALRSSHESEEPEGLYMPAMRSGPGRDAR